MSREVVSRADVRRRMAAFADTMGGQASPAADVKADGYIDRVVKYIPPDVIAAFIAIESMIKAAPPGPAVEPLAWGVFGVILLGTPFYLWKIAAVRKPLQIAISVVAFVLWAFAYPGPPFSYLNVPSASLFGAVAMGLYSFLTPLIEA